MCVEKKSGKSIVVVILHVNMFWMPRASFTHASLWYPHMLGASHRQCHLQTVQCSSFHTSFTITSVEDTHRLHKKSNFWLHLKLQDSSQVDTMATWICQTVNNSYFSFTASNSTALIVNSIYLVSPHLAPTWWRSIVASCCTGVQYIPFEGTGANCMAELRGMWKDRLLWIPVTPFTLFTKKATITCPLETVSLSVPP